MGSGAAAPGEPVGPGVGVCLGSPGSPGSLGSLGSLGTVEGRGGNGFQAPVHGDQQGRVERGSPQHGSVRALEGPVVRLCHGRRC